MSDGEPSVRARAHPGVHLLAVILLLVVFSHWLSFFGHSLGASEAATWWSITGGSSRDAGLGPLHWHPAHALLARGTSALLGTGEVALRLPSLACSLGAVALVWAIGARLRDRELGVLAALVFATQETVRLEATHARPFPLGVLLTCAAGYVLLRWADEFRWSSLLGASALVALLPFVHATFTFATPAFAAFIVARWWLAQAQPTRAQPVVGLGVMAAGVLSWAFLARSLLGAPVEGLVAPPAAGFGLWSWPHAMVALAVGVGLAGVTGSGFGGLGLDRARALLIVSWGLAPALLLNVVHWWGSVELFEARLAMAGIPALSLLYALLIRSIDSAVVRTVAGVLAAGIAIVTFVEARDDRTVEDFGCAAEILRDFGEGRPLPVFHPSSAPGARTVPWPPSPATETYLTAPLAYHGVGEPLVALPESQRRHQPTPGARFASSLEPGLVPRYGSDDLAELVRSRIGDADRVAGVELYGTDGLQWMVGVLEAEGFRLHRTHCGSVSIGLFARDGSIP